MKDQQRWGKLEGNWTCLQAFIERRTRSAPSARTNFKAHRQLKLSVALFVNYISLYYGLRPTCAART